MIPVAVANDSFGVSNDALQRVRHLQLDWIIRRRATDKFPLKDGDELMSFERVRTEDLDEKTKFHFGFEIAFGEGQIFDGDPVIPTLADLVDFTESLVRLFAKAVFKIVW